MNLLWPLAYLVPASLIVVGYTLQPSALDKHAREHHGAVVVERWRGALVVWGAVLWPVELLLVACQLVTKVLPCWLFMAAGTCSGCGAFVGRPGSPEWQAHERAAGDHDDDDDDDDDDGELEDDPDVRALRELLRADDARELPERELPGEDP